MTAISQAEKKDSVKTSVSDTSNWGEWIVNLHKRGVQCISAISYNENFLSAHKDRNLFATLAKVSEIKGALTSASTTTTTTSSGYFPWIPRLSSWFFSWNSGNKPTENSSAVSNAEQKVSSDDLKQKMEENTLEPGRRQQLQGQLREKLRDHFEGEKLPSFYASWKNLFKNFPNEIEEGVYSSQFKYLTQKENFSDEIIEACIDFAIKDPHNKLTVFEGLGKQEQKELFLEGLQMIASNNAYRKAFTAARAEEEQLLLPG